MHWVQLQLHNVQAALACQGGAAALAGADHMPLYETWKYDLSTSQSHHGILQCACLKFAHGWPSPVLSSAQRLAQLQDTIKLTKKQQLRAKGVWRQYCKDLAEAKSQRSCILDKFENSGAMMILAKAQ